MIDPIALVQVKAFARQDGFLLALVWMSSMACLVYMPESIWGLLLMLCTPFFVGWRLSEFRDRILDRKISFRRGLCFSCYTFFYASLLFALAQFVYFRFMDDGRFLMLINQAIDTITPIYKQQGIDITDLKQATALFQETGAVNLAFMFFMQNIVYGAILSPIIAVINKRSKVSK